MVSSCVVSTDNRNSFRDFHLVFYCIKKYVTHAIELLVLGVEFYFEFNFLVVWWIRMERKPSVSAIVRLWKIFSLIFKRLLI